MWAIILFATINIVVKCVRGLTHEYQVQSTLLKLKNPTTVTLYIHMYMYNESTYMYVHDIVQVHV